ncbi:efflux RND transporter periplasmic adaptor subunit [Sulfurimonas sp.]|uniref:efflux RND transporter periplasmic adaptor subunit n=1 Tax=Sulfurimonas sp. TaxID=2022749 RepID=UPI0035645932
MKKLTISLAAIAILFLGCSDDKKSSSAAQQRQMPPIPVKAHTAKLENVNFEKNYSAIIKPFQEVDVVARVNGLLVKENFTEGSYVKKGDLLYEIEKDEYKATLDTAKAANLKAKANYKKASKDYERASYLFKNSAVSEQDFDNALYAYENAQAELKRTEAELKNAQIQYDYTTIKAPISGIVGISQSDEGNYIESKNSTLTTITALDSVYAEFSIPSSDIAKYISQIKTGSDISIKVANKIHSGKVDYIAPKLDAQTDTLLVRAKLQNKERDLVIGSFVEVLLSGFSYNNVAKIPQHTLIKTPDANLVYIIKDGVATMKPVNVIDVNNGMAIIKSGVQSGDQIITSNIAKVRPNSKVSIIGGE